MKLKLLTIILLAIHGTSSSLTIQDLKATPVSQFDYGTFKLKDDFESMTDNKPPFVQYHLGIDTQDHTFVFSVFDSEIYELRDTSSNSIKINKCEKLYQKVSRFMMSKEHGNILNYYKRWGSYFVLSNSKSINHQIEIGRVVSKGAKISVSGCDKEVVLMNVYER